MQEHTFVLSDANGVEHSYVVGAMPVRKALPFAKHLLAGALKPIARLLSKVDNAEAEAYAEHVPEDKGIMSSLEGLDLSELADDLGDVLLSLPDDKIIALFENVIRDGKPLSDAAQMDAAYQYNWGEFAQAAWKIVQANGFLAFIGSRLQGS